MDTTNLEQTKMKVCKCKEPQKNGGDNYCKLCQGLIEKLLNKTDKK